MTRATDNPQAPWRLATAAVLVVAAGLALADALADGGRPWLDMGVALAGAAVLAAAGMGAVRSPWALVAGGAAVAYLMLSAAPRAVSGDVMPVARMLVSAAALLGYLVASRSLGLLPQYGLCVAALGVSAAFFLAWEPPPPKPAPIARPLTELRDDLFAKVPNWHGEHQELAPAIEDILGADTYLNLILRSGESPYRVGVFIAYNANAMTNIPHVPWVCMTQSGYELVALREDDVPHPAKHGRELKANVILFHPGQGMSPTGALMFQYFNVGGTYEVNRSMARIRATTGAIGREGSYLSQTQVSVFVPMSEAEGAMERTSEPYRLGRQFMETLIPLLEQRYYPDLEGSEGGA